jgi:hypothetical protein
MSGTAEFNAPLGKTGREALGRNARVASVAHIRTAPRALQRSCMR